MTKSKEEVNANRREKYNTNRMIKYHNDTEYRLKSLN